jgi:hypothetical protein
MLGNDKNAVNNARMESITYSLTIWDDLKEAAESEGSKLFDLIHEETAEIPDTAGLFTIVMTPEQAEELQELASLYCIMEPERTAQPEQIVAPTVAPMDYID